MDFASEPEVPLVHVLVPWGSVRLVTVVAITVLVDDPAELVPLPEGLVA